MMSVIKVMIELSLVLLWSLITMQARSTGAHEARI